jgi:hypothetical protein
MFLLILSNSVNMKMLTMFHHYDLSRWSMVHGRTLYQPLPSHPALLICLVLAFSALRDSRLRSSLNASFSWCHASMSLFCLGMFASAWGILILDELSKCKLDCEIRFCE